MAFDGLEAWALHVPLWDSETLATQARDWLKGEGKALLELKASQINSLRDAIAQARTNADLQTAIKTLGGSAAEHHKSPWNRKGEEPGLRTRLRTGVEAALAATRKHVSEERTAFEALRKLVPDETRSKLIDEERDLKIRKQFLLFVIERYQAKQWIKEDTP
jgi:hypothetical protein